VELEVGNVQLAFGAIPPLCVKDWTIGTIAAGEFWGKHRVRLVLSGHHYVGEGSRSTCVLVKGQRPVSR
jgi:hypothetical protein